MSFSGPFLTRRKTVAKLACVSEGFFVSSLEIVSPNSKMAKQNKICHKIAKEDIIGLRNYSRMKFGKKKNLLRTICYLGNF